MSDRVDELLERVAREYLTSGPESGNLLEHLQLELAAKLRAADDNFTSHYECEDGFYSCPKAENYFGTDDRNHCSCGKDIWDAAWQPAKGGEMPKEKKP